MELPRIASHTSIPPTNIELLNYNSGNLSDDTTSLLRSTRNTPSGRRPLSSCISTDYSGGASAATTSTIAAVPPPPAPNSQNTFIQPTITVPSGVGAAFQPSRKREEACALQNLKKRVQQLRVLRANQLEPVECNTVGGRDKDNNASDLDNRPQLFQKIISNRPVSMVLDSTDLRTAWQDSDFITDCLCWHNVYRQRHCSPPLTMSTQNLPIDRTKLKVLDQLLCGNCQLYLNISPIMTFKSGTTICGRCYDPIKYENVAVADKPTPNIPFESVIKLFPFPCIYRDQGCTARHTTKLYLKHEIICNFRPFKCPVKSCKWTGLMSGFKIHFEVTHTNKFSSSSVIPIDTTTTHVDYYFINVNDMELLFQYKFNDTSDKYYCDCVCLTYPKIKGAYTMELEFIKADKTSSIIFRKKMSIVLNPIDENTALEIDIKSLQTLSKTRYLNAKITVLPPELTENSYQMTDNKLLNELKCPVCLHLFVPPIFLCGNGHSICNPCKSQLVTCPICRDPYGNSVHNFTLEKLICELIYPCKYSISGCQHVAPSTQLQQHETTCDFSYL